MMFLSLYLDAGPLQSWGYGSYMENRYTNLYPTQSAITGMICRAAGCFPKKVGEKKFKEFLSRINKLKFRSILFSRSKVSMDYQTIGTSYENDQIYRASGGKYQEKGMPSTVIVRKQYLENAVTACVLEGKEEFLNEIADYIKYPQSFLWIGRACCMPTAPIFHSVNNSFCEAFISLVLSVKKRRKSFDMNDDSVIKIAFPSIKGFSINDVMVGEKQFVSRLIKEEDRTLEEWKKVLN